MIYLALISPLLAFPLVLSLQLFEKWALGTTQNDRRLVRGDRRVG